MIARLMSPVLVAVALVLTLGSLGCRRGDPAAAAAPPPPPPAVVAVRTVEPAPIEDLTEYVATLKSLRATTIKPQVDGHITRIYVKSGDRVVAGTRMFQIDPERQQASVASQDAARGAREADVAFAQQQLARMRDLYAQKVVSKQELDQAETALATAEAALKSLEARLREEQVQLGYFQVAAPTSGVVGDVPVRVGDRVTPDTELTTVDENDTLELYVPVPIERAPDLRRGLAVRLLDDAGKILAETTLTFVSPRVDDRTQSVLAKGVVRNPSGQLRSSQYVRAQVVWNAREGLRVPVLSVVRLNGQNFVFVAEPGQNGMVARQRPIKIGPIDGNEYAVLDGVKAGERVIVSGVQKIVDGAPIQPQG